jgi:hypothetical protein
VTIFVIRNPGIQEKFPAAGPLVLVFFMASWFPNKEARNAGKVQFLYFGFFHGFMVS